MMIRRLECVLEATRDDVLQEYDTRKDLGIPLQQFLVRKSGQSFYNTSKFTLSKLIADANNIGTITRSCRKTLSGARNSEGLP